MPQPLPARRARARGAFTLIELLVVVSIIAVLSAMLLPVIAMVRVQAQSTQCLSSLRQIPMAVEAYALIQDGMLVLSAYQNIDTGERTTFDTLLATQVPDVLNGYTRLTDTVANGAVAKSMLRGCPSFFGSLVAATRTTTLQGASGYGFTYRPGMPALPFATSTVYTTGGVTTGTQFALSTITSKSQRIMCAESDTYRLDVDGSSSPYVFTQPRAWSTTLMFATTAVKPGMAFTARHRKGMNAAFFDGHAERMSEEKAMDAYMDPANTKKLNR